MNNHLAAAKVLDQLMLELMDKGIDIPAHVIDDLKAGRALPGGAFLENAEMNLLASADIAGGADYADAWQRKISAAYQEGAQTAPAFAPKMVTGVPKGAYWVRVQTEALPEHIPLKHITQDDGFTLLFGAKDDVMAYLNEIRRKEREDIAKSGA